MISPDSPIKIIPRRLQGIQDDERLPEIEVEPFESHLVPLPHIEQAYNSHQVKPLDHEKADRETNQFMLDGRRKGKNSRKKYDNRLNAVASALNANTKTRGLIPDDIRYGHDVIVK